MYVFVCVCEGGGLAKLSRRLAVVREMDEEEGLCCPRCPVESPPDPSLKQAFSEPLFRKQ